MTRRIWFDRLFTPGLAPDHMPELIERLRGTPARLEARLAGLGVDALHTRQDDGWSVQSHAGHLADLEPLWIGRVHDLIDGAEVLREADLENRATWEADHDARPIEEVLGHFRTQRSELLTLMEGFDTSGLDRTALHPRLRQPMSVVDLAFFVAEHDDHHLATITGLLRTKG